MSARGARSYGRGDPGSALISLIRNLIPVTARVTRNFVPNTQSCWRHAAQKLAAADFLGETHMVADLQLHRPAQVSSKTSWSLDALILI
jgi:hypothetical protein